MTDKGNTNGPSDEKKEEKVKKTTKVIDHEIVARWVQEQILHDVPELGYLSEVLIERILKTSYRFYTQQGFTTIKLADK